MQHYLILALCLLVGQIFHLLIKANAMRKRAKAGNVPFSVMKDFIATDALEIAATFVGGIIVMLVLNEVKLIYPAIENYLRMIFVLLGYSGSSLVLSALSKAEKNVSKQIDEKTNILDDLTSNMNKTVFWGIPPSSFSQLVVEIDGVAVQGQVTVSGLPAYNSTFSIGLDTTNVNVLMHDGNNPVTLKLSNGQTFYFSTSVVADFIGNRPVRK